MLGGKMNWRDEDGVLEVVIVVVNCNMSLKER